jgi:MFS family permease
MYTTLRGIPETAARPGGPRRPRVARIVLVLGTVSFFTDLSSEMVVAVLPVYLTLVLGLTPFQYGVIDGLYQGITAAVRIVGGITADLTRRPKVVAVAGYGLSCVVKLLFLPAQSFAAVTALVAIDRSGKGLRTAPRDAMIADSAAPEALGYSFGVHRAMDTAGALGGPLIAFGVLAALVDGYDTIFVLSFSLAAIGLAVLVLFVPGHSTRPQSVTTRTTTRTTTTRTTTTRTTTTRTSHRREFADLARTRAYRRLLVVGGLLSVATISDGFVYLTLKERVDLGARMFPLLFIGTAVAYLVLAVPLGRLADRIGRARVFLGGHVVAVLGYLLLGLLPTGPVLIAGVLGLVGAYYAATDGVLPALTAAIVPVAVRSSGIAGVQTVMAVGNMVSALLFGTLWARFDPVTAVAAFSVGLTLAIVVAARLLAPAETSR